MDEVPDGHAADNEITQIKWIQIAVNQALSQFVSLSQKAQVLLCVSLDIDASKAVEDPLLGGKMGT